jgi:hypothetical protein
MSGLGMLCALTVCGVVVGGASSDGAGAFRGRRAVSSYTQTIDAPPDRVFPLLCPIRESEWADGWIGKVVYAVSGVAEADGVYATDVEGEKDDTIWVVTKYDAGARVIQLVYFVPGVRVAKLEMAVSADGASRSRVGITYTNTGLSEAGNAEIQANFESTESFARRMSLWQGAMNHYLTTGHRLKVHR